MTATPDTHAGGSPAPGSEVITMVGPAGAGKTSARSRWPDAIVISLDELRAQFSWCGCSSNQDPRLRALVVEIAFTAARTVLDRGGRVLWDATNAVATDRQALLALAAEYDAATHAVIVLPPLEQVLAQNATRSQRRCPCGYTRAVPEAVVRAMHEAITRQPPTTADGWHRVTVLDHHQSGGAVSTR
ncbi:AAA family ATPase [Amycolatopsis minnesotensis]|uniref:Kinase n=1 Tax=Amycolatopsis minnesotensis TaxID=337894 RepID=A0ABP5DNL0_9PSEU